MSITRCSYKSVRDLVLSWSGQGTTDLSAAQILQANSFINVRLRDWAWPAWWWPELCPIEQRFYRLDYASGTTYAAPTTTSASEVYFPPTQQYYQALKATTGNAPATLTSGTYVVNGAYWAVASGPYTGPDWLVSTGYTVGYIVRNPDNGRYYQCHTAHTSAGSLDATKFGILTIFDPYISRTQSSQTVIGDFLGMYLDDPRVYPNPRRVPYLTDSLGAHVQTSPSAVRWRWYGWDNGPATNYVPSYVWVRLRLKCPEFNGSTYDAAATYTAAVSTIYFAGSTTDLEGDYWLCAVNTTAGQSPETTPASWTRLEFPAWLRTAVARAAYADWLRYGAQREAASVESIAADTELYQAQIQQGAMQGQTLKWRRTA